MLTNIGFCLSLKHSTFLQTGFVMILITSFGHINLIVGVKIEYNELSSDHKNN